MKVNDYFDKIYCLNLDKRKDRWAESLAEFKKHNLTVERFPAIDGSLLDLSKYKFNMGTIPKDHIPGQIGCSLGHTAIIEDAKKNNYSKILILEDDVEFARDFVQRFSNEIAFLPEDWDLLYFSGNNIRPDENLKQVNKHFYKTSFSYTTHCYAVNSKVYDVIIEGSSKLESPIDKFYVDVMQKQYNCYIFRPHLSWQRESLSNITGKISRYNFIKK